MKVKVDEDGKATPANKEPAATPPVTESAAVESESAQEAQEQGISPGYGTSLVAAGREHRCEACGHVGKMSESVEAEAVESEAVAESESNATEAEKPTNKNKEEKMQESERPQVENAAPAQVSLIEAERAELISLRAANKYREQLAKADSAIKEAGVFVPPEELVKFSEAQWPTILRLSAGQARAYGTGEANYAIHSSDSSSESQDAENLFDAAFNRLTH